jgi:hypothetical protein
MFREWRENLNCINVEPMVYTGDFVLLLFINKVKLEVPYGLWGQKFVKLVGEARTRVMLTSYFCRLNTRKTRELALFCGGHSKQQKRTPLVMIYLQQCLTS